MHRSTGPSTALVHLVRSVNGPDALRRFCDAYRLTKNDLDHDLVFLCKGDGATDQVKEIASDLRSTIHVCTDDGFDIGAYVRLAPLLSHEILCFTNSWARPRVSCWLDILVAPFDDPAVGIVGATASFEAVPPYTSFPNPHIRSNSFALRREIFLDLVLPQPENKISAVLLEAGPNGITHQIMSRGLRAIVVGQDRVHHDLIDSRRARVYRFGDQQNLLVSDNVTDLYDRGDPAYRRFLETLAWGESSEASEEHAPV